MCGIAGFFGNGNYDTGQKMISSVKYRGPDNQGVYFNENICLCHARLSIIDLSENANQPMFSSDKRISIVFNGEIYNFEELKKGLISGGKYTFQTTSDTEVLIYLYQEYGVAMLDKIHGMFAFALYDFNLKELFIARDRMGKKPLYYSLCSDGTLVFASELKAVMQHGSVKKELNLDAMNQYLTFDYVPTPATINKGVYKLEPAQYMIFTEGKIKQKAFYWKHNFTVNNTISFDEAKIQLDKLLSDATASRLMSDVPLGVFLSGGLDSSAIAYYAQLNSKQKIKTFSIGFDDKSYDEQEYARLVANHLNTDHAYEILTPEKSIKLLDEIFPLLDEPFADASIIPTYFLSKFTRKSVTVALGGDGSDELFAGYPTFISDKFKSPVRMLPRPFINILLKAADLLPVSDANISFDFKVKQFLRGFSGNANSVHQLWLGSFLPDEKRKLLKNEIYNNLKDKGGLSVIDNYFDDPGIEGEFAKTVNYYYRTYLPDDILVKVDRASMYNSLEVRAPFLDTRIVEFANSLPEKFKHSGLKGKYILKKTMEGKLPDTIIHRPKKGFGIPLSDWIRNDLRKKIDEVLLAEDAFFDMGYVKTMLYEHHEGKRNHRKLIWNLYVMKRFIIENKY